MATANTTLAPEIFPEITLSDRCDRCGAAAQVRAVFLEGDLYFCGHHARKFNETLAKTASFIQRKEEK